MAFKNGTAVVRDIDGMSFAATVLSFMEVNLISNAPAILNACNAQDDSMYTVQYDDGTTEDFVDEEAATAANRMK